MNYEIKGDDGEVYGPISREELQAWAAEDRVGVGTPVREEGGEWRLWENFLEFQEVPVATFGVRILAFMVDTFFSVLVMSVAVLSVWGEMPSFGPITQWREVIRSPLWQELNTILQVLSMVVHLLYFILFHGWWGRTPGKALLGLRVVGLKGERLTWGAAILRGMTSLLSTYFFYLGYLVAIFTPQCRTMHDWMAGTRVVAEGRKSKKNLEEETQKT